MTREDISVTTAVGAESSVAEDIEYGGKVSGIIRLEEFKKFRHLEGSEKRLHGCSCPKELAASRTAAGCW